MWIKLFKYSERRQLFQVYGQEIMPNTIRGIGKYNAKIEICLFRFCSVGRNAEMETFRRYLAQNIFDNKMNSDSGRVAQFSCNSIVTWRNDDCISLIETDQIELFYKKLNISGIDQF